MAQELEKLYGMENKGSVLGRRKVSSLHHDVHISSGTHLASYIKVPGVKHFEPEADHSYSSSAKVKNVYSFTSTHGMMLRHRVVNDYELTCITNLCKGAARTGGSFGSVSRPCGTV
jgi:hypothetical protein